MERKNTPQLIAVITLILFLNLAYGFDALIAKLKETNSQTFTLNNTLLWVYALTGLQLSSLSRLAFLHCRRAERWRGNLEIDPAKSGRFGLIGLCAII